MCFYEVDRRFMCVGCDFRFNGFFPGWNEGGTGEGVMNILFVSVVWFVNKGTGGDCFLVGKFYATLLILFVDLRVLGMF